jgi:cytochrome P450
VTTIDHPTIDLLDPASFAHGHPYEQYRWLRQHDPVHFHPEPDGRGFWAVTGYADVREVGRHAAVFSSRGTILIPDSSALELPDNHEMMLQMDPPRHNTFRRLMIPDFMPRAVARMGDRVGELAQRIIDEVCERGECDLVDEIAGEMPSYVVADMLGLPLDDGRELYKLTEIIHSSPETNSADVNAAAINSMFEYANSVYDDRMAHPKEDLSTRLVHAEVEGRRFDQLDFALMFLLLVDAGGDTTRNVVAGGMEALFDHPGERRRLSENLDEMMPTAIEELLRWVSPVAYMRRTALEDTVLGTRDIKAGDKVVMYYGSANRDPAAFAEPDTFDLARTPNEHVAFGGGGPHFCLGAHLARVEIDAMMRELLTRLPDMEPAGPTIWQDSVFISGPKHLPVRFTAGPRRLPPE